MLDHGGRLQLHAKLYNRPVSEWLDLSTGINPNGWPVPELPTGVWSRLPEHEDGLQKIAAAYYQTKLLLAVPGSQAAIQFLPLLRPKSNVGIISPAYAEHQHCWQQAGHNVQTLNSAQVTDTLASLDVLIVVNPNNPTGETFSKAQLLDWHKRLQKNQAWLIIDEAFIDSTPEQSLAPLCPQPGLIILRSLGKFFGLAGLRVGFVLAEESVLNQLAQKLGPWPLSSPSRYLAIRALGDKAWQKHACHRLHQESLRLKELLKQHRLSPSGGCTLYQWVKHAKAEAIHDQLAHTGILTRLFHAPSSLRFGMPGTEYDWIRLEAALYTFQGDE